MAVLAFCRVDDYSMTSKAHHFDRIRDDDRL
jgi:hypothetical protein